MFDLKKKILGLVDCHLDLSAQTLKDVFVACMFETLVGSSFMNRVDYYLSSNWNMSLCHRSNI